MESRRGTAAQQNDQRKKEVTIGTQQVDDMLLKHQSRDAASARQTSVEDVNGERKKTTDESKDIAWWNSLSAQDHV